MAERKFIDVNFRNASGGPRTIHDDAGTPLTIPHDTVFQGKILANDEADYRALGFVDHDDDDSNVGDPFANLGELNKAQLLEAARRDGLSSLAEQGGLDERDLRDAIQLHRDGQADRENDDQGGEAPTVAQLIGANNREALVDMAKAEGVEHGDTATKTEIAQAIVDKRAAA